MLRFINIFALLFLGAIILHGSNNDSTSISFSNRTIDFQAIYEADGIIPVSFEYTNTGNTPLIINRLIAPGFTSTDFPKDSIYPGKSGVIQANINPFGRKGYFKKTINVFSNTINSPEELTVKGKILSGTFTSSFKYSIGELFFRQAQINFGYIYNGELITRYVPVHNKSKSPLKVSFDNIPNHLTISENFNVLTPGSSGLIEITYNTSYIDDWDFVIDNILVTVKTDIETTSKLTITANIREDFSLLSKADRIQKPKVLIPIQVYNFDTIASGKSTHNEFPVYNNGTRDLIIRAVKPTCGCTSVMPLKNTIPPGDSTSIVVEFNSLGFNGKNKKGVTVITNDPINYKHFLWVTGFVE